MTPASTADRLAFRDALHSRLIEGGEPVLGEPATLFEAYGLLVAKGRLPADHLPPETVEKMRARHVELVESLRAG